MMDKTKNEGLQTARCCYGEKQQIVSITNHTFNLYYTEVVTNAPFIGWHAWLFWSWRLLCSAVHKMLYLHPLTLINHKIYQIRWKQRISQKTSERSGCRLVSTRGQNSGLFSNRNKYPSKIWLFTTKCAYLSCLPLINGGNHCHVIQ